MLSESGVPFSVSFPRDQTIEMIKGDIVDDGESVTGSNRAAVPATSMIRRRSFLGRVALVGTAAATVGVAGTGGVLREANAGVPSAAAFLFSAAPVLTTISPQLPSSADTSSPLAICGQSWRCHDGPSAFLATSTELSSSRLK